MLPSETESRLTASQRSRPRMCSGRFSAATLWHHSYRPSLPPASMRLGSAGRAVSTAAVRPGPLGSSTSPGTSGRASAVITVVPPRHRLGGLPRNHG